MFHDMLKCIIKYRGKVKTIVSASQLKISDTEHGIYAGTDVLSAEFQAELVISTLTELVDLICY